MLLHTSNIELNYH